MATVTLVDLRLLLITRVVYLLELVDFRLQNHPHLLHRILLPHSSIILHLMEGDCDLPIIAIIIVIIIVEQQLIAAVASYSNFGK